MGGLYTFSTVVLDALKQSDPEVRSFEYPVHQMLTGQPVLSSCVTDDENALQTRL